MADKKNSMIEKWWRQGCALAAVLALAGCARPHNAAPLHPHVSGTVVGKSYTSPHGGFTVPFPVSPEVGGRIVHDDAQSVTFHDNWGSKISFYARPIEPQSPMRQVVETEGAEKALRMFMKDIYGDLVAPHFHSDILNGAISLVFVKAVGPKTGVASFIHGKRIYLVETDILPGVELLAKNDDDSRLARDEWLEQRALELLQTMDVK